MICNKCYYNNDDNSMFCIKCGEKLKDTSTNVVNNNQQATQNVTSQNNNQQPVQNVSAQNNMGNVPKYNSASAIVALIASFLCCTNVIGIVFAVLSLIEGSKVSQFVQFGDMISANNSLVQAKKWGKYAWIATGVVAVLAVIFYIVYFVFILGITIFSNNY